MTHYYGEPPIIISNNISISPTEMCFVQYLPIKMSYFEQLGDDVKIPNNLLWTQPLIDLIHKDILQDHYVYLTVKHIYVSPNNMGNRPGWHSDGFQTDDINYIWTDKFPTEFCIQHFNIDNDCQKSMTQMQEQVNLNNIKTYGENSLVKLNQFNIHRTPEIGCGYRTFIKISLSKNQYNLQGNAHNYLFDYQWNMKQRMDERNHPHQ